ncbi:endonuclease [Leptolyngbya sp. 'hensonii']|nr:PD-(D/E)XK nuclease family protein [Leptolyngbya sp. 'hensonii']OLP20077.1 endonuclease [Leptolyngbya sp. 'hensonii']
MAYSLSASKLQTYHRCAFSYYVRYERKVNTNQFFGTAALGTAIHQTLAQAHRDWHYQEPLPALDWFLSCWSAQAQDLSPTQVEEGRQLLGFYYDRFIASQVSLHRPLAVEGRIQASLQVENLEFSLTGRYDRLDYAEDGLELIDYKTTKEVKLSHPEEMDLQIGLYYLALEQVYHQTLRGMSLLYLRTGERVRYEATPEHQERVQQVIADLAWKLRHETEWEPQPGSHCDRCAYGRYCAAVSESPVPLPEGCAAGRGNLQLVLSF